MLTKFVKGFFKVAQDAKSLAFRALFAGKATLNQQDLDDFETLLLKSDFGTETTKVIMSKFIAQINSCSPDISLLENIVLDILSSCEIPLKIAENKINVILICGTNGSGKTTSIGKLASLLGNSKKVLIAACDTFRAGAIDQLQEWSTRAGAQFFSDNTKKDPASIAYLAVEKAERENYDVLLIDTSGRMSNNANLIQELKKIDRVTRSAASDRCEHQTLMVLDGSIGQNSFSQLEVFGKALSITGLIVTKMDGSAKAGSIVGVAHKYKIPIHLIGTGETLKDLVPFDAKAFTHALFAH